MSRPRIRIIHHLARSGGTLISRCLGAMRGVVLLSEMHPAGSQFYNPLQQAAEWYNLLDDADQERINQQPPDFAGAIALITERCKDRGKTLLLRDWSHLDYTGVPFCKPGFKPRLDLELTDRFKLVCTSSVRHPLDQWLSLEKQMPALGRIHLETYMHGVRRFAEQAVNTGFIRYEDFTQDPEQGVRLLCKRLEIEYDPDFINHWADNERVTGDVAGNRAGGLIKNLSRQQVPDGLQQRLAACEDYQQVLSLLGYDP